MAQLRAPFASSSPPADMKVTPGDIFRQQSLIRNNPRYASESHLDIVDRRVSPRGGTACALVLAI